ncbi:MAG: SDR family oxidoreductase [Leptolyngbya sp. RL_3_1]|nr:SDR family oxidoreductase [Leptolyngbya sp. RL_3_1]
MTTALITGASSGIGAVFAEKLAASQHDLVLVARSADKLQALANRLSQQHGIQATVIAQDLTAADGPKRVWDQLASQGIEVDVLINNAGYGTYGEFATGELDNHLNMIQLNVVALVDLAYRCLQGMKARGSGSIVNIGSTASFQALPYLGIYAATKAFVLSFSEALWQECKPYGVKVLAVCPGPTETEFFKVADFPTSLGESVGQNYASPEAVVDEALKALEKGQANVVTGGDHEPGVGECRAVLPRETLVGAVGKMFKGK